MLGSGDPGGNEEIDDRQGDHRGAQATPGGTSIAAPGGPRAALYAFLAFYVTCLAITWAVYTRKGGLLYDVERGSTPPAPRERTVAGEQG